MFARTYLPSKVSEVLPAWKADLAKTSTKAAERLADPSTYENLFPRHAESLEVEKFVAAERQQLKPASLFQSVKVRMTVQPTFSMPYTKAGTVYGCFCKKKKLEKREGG